MQPADQLHIDTPEQIALQLPLAGVGSRFLGLAVDTILQVFLYVLGTVLFVYTGADNVVDRYTTGISTGVGAAIGILFTFCVYWGYFVFFEIIWKGQTPGKRVARIRVIHESGRPLNVYEAIGRNLLRVIDGLPGMYGVGVVCMLLNHKNRRLGDFVAGTVVVHDRRPDATQLELTATSSPAESGSDASLHKAAEKVGTNPLLAKVTPDELLLIESYLQRRLELEWAVRDKTAYHIASRITARTGLQREPDQSLDDFLETIARQVRDGARFR